MAWYVLFVRRITQHWDTITQHQDSITQHCDSITQHWASSHSTGLQALVASHNTTGNVAQPRTSLTLLSLLCLQVLMSYEIINGALLKKFDLNRDVWIPQQM
jgi:hypothetical protein